VSRPLSLAAILLLLPAVATADDGPAIPLAGRPEIFSGASGRFLLEAEVDPDTMAMEEPCVLRVYITAAGPVAAAPERLVLSDLLLADFHVEELGVFPSLSETARAATLFGLGSGEQPALLSLAGLVPTRSWEFRYRLRPKRLDVDEVPGVAFCFHDPLLLTASKPFMTQYADPLPIRVVKGESTVRALVGTEATFAWQAAGALDRWERPSLPGWPVLLGLATLPVVGCVVWYRVWRRLYPDAARQALIRRSRAAKVALAELARVRSPLDRAGANRAAAALGRYLRERLDLRTNEPTPGEVVAHFERVGLAAHGQEVHRLLDALDAHRFASAVGDADIVASLRRLILTLEEEPCLASA